MASTRATASSALYLHYEDARAPRTAVGPPLTGPRRVDHYQSLRLSEASLRRYRHAVRLFVQWLDQYQLVSTTAEEYDDLLVEYKNAEETTVSRAHVGLLLSAIEWFYPSFKRCRDWSHQVLSGWKSACRRPTRPRWACTRPRA